MRCTPILEIISLQVAEKALVHRCGSTNMRL
jgi:hypothetical protein